MIVDFTSEYDHLKVSQAGEILQRVVFTYDKIGRFSCFDASGLAVDPDDLGISQCGCMKGICRRDTAVFNEVIDLSPHIIVRDERTACIGSETNGDVILQGFNRTVDNTLKYDLAVFLCHLSAVADASVK